MPLRSRSSSASREDELRLPRVPGIVRRFWARHPLLADVVIAFVCLLLTIGATTSRRVTAPDAEPVVMTEAIVVFSLGAIACLLLLRRRRWPVAVYVASVVTAFVFLFTPAPVGPPLLLVTSYTLAVYRSSRAGWLGLGFGVGALAGTGLLLWVTGILPFDVVANAVVGEAVLAVIGTLIGVNVGNRKRYVEAIIDRSRQLLIERDQQSELAASAERARIAREMHDIVSHSLTVIVALAEGAAATPDERRARAATEHISTTARAALNEMRAMLGVLRDDRIGAVPLTPINDDAVSAAVESARNAGFPVVLRTKHDPARSADLPRAIALATSRIVQEGLTNAMRHAPMATMIEVNVVSRDDSITVEVVNDGVAGADHLGESGRSGGYGLRGLQERVDHVDGTLDAGPTSNDSWRLRAQLPLHRDPGEAK